jgi:hypothetical protein
MHSDLELLVVYDMFVNGWDSSNKDDIIAYWAALLQ